jgi:hypothetical protein
MRRQLAAILLLVFFAACAAAPDEAWLRITEIRPSGSGSAVAVIDVDVNDGTSETVDVVMQNTTSIVGSSSSSGVGLTVFNVRIEYRAAGRDLPPSEYPVAFFLNAPGSGISSSDTLEDLPIVPVTLKDWIRDPANFPSNLLEDFLLVEARLIVRARTDEGRHIESEASVSLAFR